MDLEVRQVEEMLRKQASEEGFGLVVAMRSGPNNVHLKCHRHGTGSGAPVIS